jgi:hypothetical protein
MRGRDVGPDLPRSLRDGGEDRLSRHSQTLASSTPETARYSGPTQFSTRSMCTGNILDAFSSEKNPANLNTRRFVHVLYAAAP